MQPAQMIRRQFPELTASYVVWVEGATIYAKNGHTGQVTSGATAHTFLNALMVTLGAAGGGTIQLKGTITTVGALTAVSGVNVVGPATINCNTISTLNALDVPSVTDSVWKDLTIQRSGVVDPGNYVVYTSGTTSNTVRFLNCRIINLTTGDFCDGFHTDDSSAPVVSACTITGGTGIRCYGFYADGSSAPVVSACTITGGAGDGGFGFYTSGSSAPVVSGCTITGGAGSTACDGFETDDSSAPTVSGCIITGGAAAGGGGNNGFYNESSSAFVVSGCIITGGAGAGGGNCGFYTELFSTPVISGCIITGGGGTSSYGFYTSSSSAPVVSGCTIMGGAGGTSCHGAHIDTDGYARIMDSSILSNSVSDALYATDNAETTNAWRVTNCHIETKDPVTQRSIISQSAYANGPIYNCVLIGLVVNIVPAAGTAVGSNIQV